MGKKNLENLNTLRQLAGEGKTYDDIAEVLGVAYPTVYALARKHNIAVARKSKIAQSAEDIKRLAAEGKSAKQIADELGLSAQSVSNFAKAQGITLTKQHKVESDNPKDKISKKRAERLVKVEEMFNSGIPSAEIARQTGVSREMVRKDLELLGLNATAANQAKRVRDAEWISVFAAEGLTVPEITEATGLTRSFIRSIGEEFSIKFSRLKAVDHGTLLCYRRGCNCAPCRAANTKFYNESKERRLQKGIPEHLHGTESGYQNWECRCDPCTEAGAAANKRATIVPGLDPHRLHTEWSQEEDRIVADYSRTAKELALKLNRSVGAVNARRNLLAKRPAAESKENLLKV